MTSTTTSSSKLLLALVAAAGLGGCAVYPAPGYGPYETAGAGYGQPYPVEAAPVYINGGVTYQRSYGPPPVHYGGRVYQRPGYAPGYGGRDRDGDGIPNRIDRDRDGDGIRNRADRDRDNDGVRNRRDARPNNPNQR